MDGALFCQTQGVAYALDLKLGPAHESSSGALLVEQAKPRDFNWDSLVCCLMWDLDFISSTTTLSHMESHSTYHYYVGNRALTS